MSRIRLFYFLLVFSFACLGGALAWLQLVEGSRYRSLSEENRIRLLHSLPPRGVILDRRGEILASNRAIFSLSIPVSSLQGAMKKKLGEMLDIDASGWQRVMKTREYGFVTLKENLQPELFVPLLERPLVPGLLVKTDPHRMVFGGEELGSVLGYLGEVDPEEVSVERPAGSLVGRAGIESFYDGVLRGEAGGQQVEVNARGQILRIVGEKRAQPGATLQLTIDIRLQRYAQHLLKGKRGAVVILRAGDGEVLTLVSSPSFSPNFLTPPTKAKEWKRILTDPQKPLLNRAISGLYPPGSVFKLVTFMASRVQGDRQFFCPGYKKVGDRIFRCWLRSGHGRVDLVRGVAESCDVVFYTLGLEAGAEHVLKRASALGFGERTGIDLPGEKKGFLPSPAWKKAQKAARWFSGDTANLSIGQGFLQVTPIQVSKLVAMIANGGREIVPHLVLKIGEEPVVSSVVQSKEVGVPRGKLALLREGMLQAVENGTGKQARVRGMAIAGKTGTAQDPPRKKPHAWFAGYAPYPEGRVALVVLVEEGGEGGKVAAPIAGKLFYALKKLGYL